MDSKTIAWIDQQRADLTTTVRRFGWSIEYVGGGSCEVAGGTCAADEGPAFAYTVGLFGLDHPELLVFDVPPGVAGLVLNGLGDRIRRGESLLPGVVVEVDGWRRRIVPEVVPNPGEIVLTANAYYHRPAEVSVPVLQLTWEDAAGRFPWDDGGPGPERQPRPGTFRA